ncbi:MAG: 7-cyano-7-deazaguanine synthase [Candidatus Omnitrophica bacterium]|nr:7-cyano-7-deazaguanine synthase [Candidatus Omnitrophota bacterium]
MTKKAVLMLSGGLDSTLALCILREQGIEIEAVNFVTAFSCCKLESLEIARKFGAKVTTVSVNDDYFKMIEKPKYGWGRGINPCVDCRIYMFRLAKKLMDATGASFVASGEVLGQRPMSQKFHQLEIIERDSGLSDRLLRPLSAKLLAPTLPEREGVVDREKLYGISGRSRKELLELAAKYGIEEPPTPSTGCLLTEPDFADKVRDLFDHKPHYERWDFETLKVGRHYRLGPNTKIILGRNQEENLKLELLNARESILLIPESFKGPSALIVGETGEAAENKAMELILQYSKLGKSSPAPQARFERRQSGGRDFLSWPPAGAERNLESLRIGGQ